MKDFVMIAVTLAVIALGYLVMKKIDYLIRGQISMRNKHRRQILIGAKSREQFDFVSAVLALHNDDIPLDLSFHRGSVKQLLRQLSRGSVDIVLVSEEDAPLIGNAYSSVTINYADIPGFEQKNGSISAVWSREHSLLERDHIIFILENEHYRVKQGFCDYLD